MVTACKLLPKSLYFSSCPDAECSVLIGQILAEYGLVACYNAVKCLARFTDSRHVMLSLIPRSHSLGMGPQR